MSYTGQYIEISDSTQEALDLKANLDGGNNIQGDQNLSNGNIVIANGSYLQGNEIVGNNELYLRTLGNENIRLEPAGNGKVTMNKSLDITGGGNITLYGSSYLQGKEIVGNNELYLRTLGNKNIRLEPAGTGTITGTKDINLSAGKQYLIDGVASVGITPAQASEIQANTLKVGITPAQASELSQNTINITALDNDKANKAGGNIFTGNQQLTSANYDIVTSGEYRKDGVNILDPYRTSAATDTLLDAKASKSSSNVFDGIFNRFNTNVIVEENHLLQTAQIYGFAGLDIGTSSNEDIALAPHGTGKVSSTKDIDLATGKSYKVNGTDILTPYRTSAATDLLLDAKADLAGNKTFTGGNVDVEGGYLAVDDGNLFVNGATRNIQCRRIIGSTADLLIGSNIESEGNINLANGKAYKVSGTDILTPYRTSAATDLLLDDKANDNAVVKLTGDQDIDGIKTFEEDMKLEKDLLFTTDDSVIKFGLDSDITLTHSADTGLTTNGTFSATQYNINGTQIASSNLSDGGSLAPINDANFTGFTKMTRLQVNHSDTTTVGLDFNNTNVNQYAGAFNTAAYGWRFYNDNTSQSTLTNTTFGVFTNGTGVELNPLLIKNDGILYTLNQEVDGDVNLTAGKAYKIDNVSIPTNADLDLKAPINDADFTGFTKMTRLRVNHSDSTTIGLDFNNTNVNQYAGAFNTAAYGWRFYNDNTSQSTLTNTTFGVFTNGTGVELNPLLIKNDGILYTLDQEVTGSINATGNMRAQAIPLGSGVSNQQPPTGALSGSFYKNSGGVLYVTP